MLQKKKKVKIQNAYKVTRIREKLLFKVNSNEC